MAKRYKAIPLKSFETANGETHTYGGLLRSLVSRPLEGATYEDMRRKIKILDLIDAAQDELVLDHAQHREVADICKRHHFGMVDLGFIKFVEDVDEAPDTDPPTDADSEKE